MLAQIKIVLADDHPLMRRGLRQIIESEPDLLIAAEASDGAEALAAIKQFAPNVAILDVDMPRLSGFDVLRQLSERGDGAATRSIMLTVHDEPEFLNEARRLGAAAYLLKDSAIEEIVTAIRAVAAGESFVSQRLHQHLFRSMVTAAASLTSLTATERQILKLVAEYKTSRDIADVLSLSLHTIKTHRRNISAKLNIEGSNQLMKFALENKTLL